MSKVGINVAMVEPVGGHGGCNYYDFALCESLAEAGCRVTLYTCDKTTVSGKEGFPVALTYVNIFGKDKALVRGLRYVWGSLRSLVPARLRGARIAHFHLFHVGPLEFFNITLSRLLRMKVVITAHDVEAFKQGLSVPTLARWVYRNADLVIAHNQVSRDELVNVLGVPDQSVKVIAHGNYMAYVSDDLTRVQARAILGYAEEDKVVLFFGQIKEVKGLDVLIRAFAAARGHDPGLRLIIAGKVWKDNFETYERLIRELGLEDACNCQIRYIPDDELPVFYRAADLVALPYRKIYQSGVVLMAMSYGCPVLVSDLPGMLEVVVDGESGFVFKSGDHEAMARCIIDAVSTPGLLDRVAAGGLQRVKDAYDWRKIGLQTLACYQHLLAR